MSAIKAGSLSLVFTWILLSANAQSWTDSIRVNVRTSTANPTQVLSTWFRIWIPPAAADVKAILLVSARGVGFNNGADGSGIYGRGNDFKFALNPIIRKMAAETNTAVVCIQGATDAGMVIDFDPQLGHGDTLLSAILRLSNRTQHPELKFVPFLAFGHSLGAVFSNNLAYWNPDRVAGVICYQTGGWIGPPTWTSPLNPSMSVRTVPFFSPNGECEGPDINNNSGWYYASTVFNTVRTLRTQLRPVMPAIRVNGSHSILMPQEAELIAAFLRKTIQYRIPVTAGPATEEVELDTLNQSEGWLGNLTAYNSFDPVIQPWNATVERNQFWLFDEEFARSWKLYHTPKIRYTLSRPGPYCANDTLTVNYATTEPVSFGPHNHFRLEMSSIRGDFDSYSFTLRILGSIASTQNSGSFLVRIPDNLQRVQSVANGTPQRYRIRLVSTQPVLESPNLGEVSMGLCQQPPYNTMAYITNGASPMQLCTGTSDSLSVTVGRMTALTLNPDNLVLFELSDSSGSFSNPVLLRTVASQITAGVGFPNIVVKVGIPPGIGPGSAYRIRIRTTDPADTSTTTGSDFRLVGIEPQIFKDEDKLVAPYSGRYQWLKDEQEIPGEIFQIFRPQGEGNYSCKLFNGNCVQTSSVMTIASVSGEIFREGILFPNPGAETFEWKTRVPETLNQIRILDSRGRKVLEKEVTGNRFRLDGFEPGWYIIGLETSSGTTWKKLLLNP